MFLYRTLKDLEPRKDSQGMVELSEQERCRIGLSLYKSGLIFRCEAPNNNMHGFNGRVEMGGNMEIKVEVC